MYNYDGSYAEIEVGSTPAPEVDPPVFIEATLVVCKSSFLG